MVLSGDLRNFFWGVVEWCFCWGYGKMRRDKRGAFGGESWCKRGDLCG
jgi:hypothetical protein